MPDGRRLRGIKGREAVRAFVRAGGIRRSGKGDHINIKMPNGSLITMLGRAELKVGLLRRPLKEQA